MPGVLHGYRLWRLVPCAQKASPPEPFGHSPQAAPDRHLPSGTMARLLPSSHDRCAAPAGGFPDPDRLLVALYARGSCSLMATDPDGADRLADVVHDANGPFGFRPETAVQVFQPLAHENHGSIAGRLRARKLGAGWRAGPSVVEVKKIASHGPGNADAFSIVAQRLSVLLKPAKGL